MFIAHEFCVDEYLKEGENTLTVHLRSALVEAQDKDYTLKMLIDSHGRYEKSTVWNCRYRDRSGTDLL